MGAVTLLPIHIQYMVNSSALYVMPARDRPQLGVLEGKEESAGVGIYMGKASITASSAPPRPL